MNQMNLPEQLKESFSKYLGLEDEHDHEDPCDDPIKKLKLGKFFKKESPVEVQDKYENFLNVSIQLDSYKSVNVRSSDEILEFIGDIGGFTDAVHMIFAVFGTFFSSRFIVSSLAKDMFLVKTNNSDGSYEKDHKKIKPNQLELKKFKEDGSYNTSINDSAKDSDYQGDGGGTELLNKRQIRKNVFDNKFKEIKISAMEVLLDPLLAIIFCPFACCFSSCRSFRNRTEILEKSAERISQELDIIHLLHKIRLSNDLWNNLLGKRQKEMLKFQRSGVIDADHLESSSSSHESSSSSDGKENKFKQPTEFKQIFNEAILHGL